MAEYLETLVQNFSVTSPVGGTLVTVMSEEVSLSPAALAQAITVVAERIAATGAAYPRVELTEAITEEVDYQAALAIGWRLALAEGVALAGTASAYAGRVGAIVDTLHATGAVATRLDAQVVLTHAIALNTLLASGWKETAVASAAFSSALGATLHAVAPIVEAAGFDDNVGAALRLTAVTSESVDFDDSLGAALELTAKVTEGVLLYAVLRLGDKEYSGWVLNQGAASEYRNFPFNGFAKVQGKYLGTTNDGLYLLEGTDDDGEPIAAHIKTPLLDFGTALLKRVPDVYVAMATGGRVVLKVVTTGTEGQQREDIYTHTVRPGAALHGNQLKVGGGLKSTYWQWQLENVDGGAFDLDQMQFRPLILSRRV